jgi:hypothetical protein
VKVAFAVMGVLLLALAVPAALRENPEHTEPHQELARAVLVPTEKERRVIVPPCGTGVPVASIPPEKLATTSGAISFILKQERGDRIVLVPRCRASKGASPSEGANLPSAAFILPLGARIEAGRGGSVEAGTELVQSQLVVPANSSIETVIVPRCIESKPEATVTATGRALILDPQPGRPKVGLAGPC